MISHRLLNRLIYKKEKKLTIIGGTDPFVGVVGELCERIPPLESTDIVSYLALRTSFVTAEQLKARGEAKFAAFSCLEQQILKINFAYCEILKSIFLLIVPPVSLVDLAMGCYQEHSSIMQGYYLSCSTRIALLILIW